MYVLFRYFIVEQFTETENRCKHLENQLLLSVQTNSELQRNEAILKERLLKLPNIVEFEELVKKLKETENEAVSTLTLSTISFDHVD